MKHSNHESPEEFIETINAQLISNSLSSLNDQVVCNYFDAFKKFFLEEAASIKHFTNDRQRRGSINKICQLNQLYAIQMKLDIDLPDFLEEIAYDFDNPDYPGYGYTLNKILDNKYKILIG